MKLIENGIAIGRNLSQDYNLNVGDKISIMSTSGVQTIVGTFPKQESFLITSIFSSGLADFDRNIAFLNINSLENLFDDILPSILTKRKEINTQSCNSK